MMKGRHRAREKRARRYFKGGEMPDGLQLYALDGGKLEIMQEIITASADGTIDEDDLGNCFLKLYCSTYSEIRDLELEDIADLGRQIAREATLEDRQAAEEVIVDDFNALSASMTSSPKGQARREGQHLSSTQHISGQDSSLATAETNLKPSQPSNLYKSPSQTHTPTSQKIRVFNGSTPTAQKLTQQREV